MSDFKEKTGEVFSIAADNEPVRGCTISKSVYNGLFDISYFSLGENTDISAEIYSYHKLIIVASGSMEVYGKDGAKELTAGECILTATEQPVGMRSSGGAVYTEVSIRRKEIMNDMIKAGEVFKLADLVPYASGRIVNMDIVNNDKMKFVVMSFDEGCSLPEHAAPGEALIFALDGSGLIGYEGKEHPIKAGENFHFAKQGRHFIKATKRFKMALLLTLE